MKQLINKTNMKIKKNAPAILTGVGIAGLGATAYLAYKSRSKVEAVIEEIEEARDLAAENGEELELDKVKVARDIAEAVYLPVLVGALSMSAIFMSYRIQNNRIAVLAGALATQQAQNIYFENKYRKVHGDEAYHKFVAPTEDVEHTEVDGKGKTKVTVQQVKKDIDHTIGQWFDESQEYYSDDHTYNTTYIESVNDRMQTLLFQRGTLLLNEVREALGFERIRAGQLLGWTSSDNFDIEKVVTVMLDDKQQLKEQIWVTWTRPRYIYEEIDFNGRYNPFN